MTATLVKFTIYRPGPLGDTIPDSGQIICTPTLRRHIEGGDPPDVTVLPARFTVHLGKALYDEDGTTVLQPATPGVAWAMLEPTDAGEYAGIWGWTFNVRASAGFKGTYLVPTSVGTVDFGDLQQVAPDSFDPIAPPAQAWQDALDAAVDAAVASLVAGAPTALDTLNELAAALGDDPNFATTVATSLAAKIESVAGLTGTAITATALKTALNLPADTADALLDEVALRMAADDLLTTSIEQEVTDRMAAVTAEATVRAADDLALQADIDAEAIDRAAADTVLDARLDTLELDTAPGKELGYAERTTSATSTAQSVAAATAISGLSVTVTGKGRPVDIEFYCASVTHSVANTTVSVGILCNGNVLGPGSQYGATASASTTAGQGRSLCIKRRMVLTDGVSYTFTVRTFALGVAGTSTLFAAADYEPLYLAVTAR